MCAGDDPRDRDTLPGGKTMMPDPYDTWIDVPVGWLLGVDTSAAQGFVDWPALVELGVSFAFIKATDGQHSVDHTWATNSYTAVSVVPFGAYGVLEPNSAASAQAMHFASVVRDSGATLPPVLDFELSKGPADTLALRSAVTWLDVVEQELGRQAIVYTGPSFFMDLVKHNGHADADKIAARPLWIAHYGVKAPLVPASWQDWTIWQASGDHAAKTPSGSPIDIDYYRGSIGDLQALGKL